MASEVDRRLESERAHREVAQGTAQLLSGRIVLLVTGFAVSMILARALGPAAFGAYGIIISVLTWVETVQSSGVLGATENLTPQHTHAPHLLEWTAKALLMGWSVVLWAVVWYGAPTLARLVEIDDGAWILRLASLDILLMGWVFALRGVLTGQRRFGEFSLTLVIPAVTKLACIVGLMAVGLTVELAIVAHVLGTVAVLLYLFVRYRSRPARPSLQLATVMVRIGTHVSIGEIATQLLINFGFWLLPVLSPGRDAETGLYVAALHLTRMLTLVPSVLSGVIFVALAWSLSEGDRETRRAAAQHRIQAAMRIAVLILALPTAILLVDARPVLNLLYSGVYGEGAGILRGLTLAFVAFALLDLLFSALMTSGRFAFGAGALAALIPVNLLLSLLLIPRLGAVGLALALLLTFAGAATVGIVASIRRFGAIMSPSSLLRCLGASAVVAAAAALFPIDGPVLLVKLVVLGLLYVLLLAVSGELKTADVTALFAWVRPRR
jgi:O-antigen/teichoic acid export membrane protein